MRATLVHVPDLPNDGLSRFGPLGVHDAARRCRVHRNAGKLASTHPARESPGAGRGLGAFEQASLAQLILGLHQRLKQAWQESSRKADPFSLRETLCLGCF